MNGGNVSRGSISAGYVEFFIDPTFAIDDGLGLIFCSAETHYRKFGDDYASGVRLESEKQWDGAAEFWLVRAFVDGGLVWDDDHVASGKMSCKVSWDGVYNVAGDLWLVSNLEIEIWNGASSVYTSSLGDVLQSLGVARVPSTIPLVGIPPWFRCYGEGVMPLRRPGSASSGSSSGTVSCGWRGDGGTLPCVYSVSGTPPGCVNAAPALGTISGTDTWALSMTCGHSVSATRTGGVYGFGGADYTAKGGEICPCHDADRSVNRIGTDYRAFWSRNGTPALIKRLTSDCVSVVGGVSTTDSAETTATLTPERDSNISVVEPAPHAIEDGLNDTAWSLARVWGSKDHYDYVNNVDTNRYLRTDSIGAVEAEAAPASAFGHLNAFSGVTRWWDYLVNIHWSYTLWFEDWDVDASPAPLDFYWVPGRQQWMFNTALPVGEQYQTRNNIVLDAVGAGSGLAGWWALNAGHNYRQIGASRWQTRNVTPRTSYAYTSSDSALFALENCTGAFGGSIVLTATGGATTIAYELDLAGFGSASELWNFLADQYKLDWTTTNVSAIRHYFGGADGNQNLLTFSKGVWTDRDRAESTKYAQSLAIDNGLGVTVDVGVDSLASGDSAAAMASNERCHAFELASGSTWQKLRVEVDLVATGSCTLNYPEFRVSQTTDPGMVNESGQCTAFIYDDQAGFRLGNAFWTNPLTGELLTTPYVTGAGLQQNVVDILCWRNVQLLGSERSTNLTSDLATLYDSVEGQAVEDVAFSTAGVVLPSPTRTQFQLAQMNLLAEVPPLSLFPRPARNASWAESGAYALESWSWAPSPQRYVCAGSDEIKVYKSDGVTLVTAVEAGYVPGWSVSKHEAVLTNSETGYLLKVAGTEYAQIRPFRGCLGVFSLRETTGGGVSYDVSQSMRHARAVVQSPELWIGRANNAPFPLSFADTKVLSNSDWASIRWNKRSRGQELWIANESSGAVTLYKSVDGGGSVSLVGLIGSGTKPSLCVSRSGLVLLFFRSGGDLKVQTRDALGSIVTATATAIAAIDDQGVAVYERFNGSQGREFVCLYVTGGDLYRSVSQDGVTWGAGALVESGCKKPAAWVDPSGKIVECWIKSASIRGRTLDQTGTVVNSIGDFVASGVDDSQIAVAGSAGVNGQFRAALLYSGSGMLVQVDSYDLVSWS